MTKKIQKNLNSSPLSDLSRDRLALGRVAECYRATMVRTGHTYKGFFYVTSKTGFARRIERNRLINAVHQCRSPAVPQYSSALVNFSGFMDLCSIKENGSDAVQQ